MNTAFSLTETGMRHLLCPLMGLNATYASNGNQPSAMKSFFGSGSKYNGRRDKSKQYGLWVPLCADCHRKAPDAVHNCAATRLRLEQDGQRRAMAYYHWTVSDFRRRFYKNYLDITED